MKQLFYLLFIVTAISCSKNPVKKPERLLEEEVMVDIIYDVSLLQAIEGAYPNKLIEQNIKPNQFIFEKYQIDSVTYKENQLYYAADSRVYKRIYKKVSERLDQNIQKAGKVINDPVKNNVIEVSE
ncbi:DUF4296 domain-containing protein [Flavobacterium sp. UBA6195]|jgi:hypothetical protein|uniref:DUF4296 domain-containing protein n=1 Tax=Flavobacterium sp. UBA6195 TaxID=1946554 RepID=UPI0011D8FB8F|nr:DUF4296 domain-containing protein [Flavobacterium sp. UBA6195]TXI68287.1 MAG: DUF4296 domain-containing protein [Flavobacterium sp.]